MAVGIGYLAFAKRDKFPMEAWMLGVALVALPLCSSSLASFNRFAFANWVLYPAYASLADRLPIWWRRAVLGHRRDRLRRSRRTTWSAASPSTASSADRPAPHDISPLMRLFCA